MIRPPHRRGCQCEWCTALHVAARRKAQQWKPIPPRDKDTDVRQEAPNERPFVNVIPINRRSKQMAEAQERHPSTVSVTGPGITGVTVNGVPIDYTANVGENTHLLTADELASAHRAANDAVHEPQALLHTPNVVKADMHLNPPPYERVVAASVEFPRVPGRKPKSSGCWYCEGQHSSVEPYCDVCVYMLADYIRWLEND